MFAVNVGKADCILLTCGDDIYMVDTGRASTWGSVSAALQLRGIDHLTGVIITHTDKDHTGGLMALASSSIRVDSWYASAYFNGIKRKKHPAVLAAALCGQEVIWLKAGDTLPLQGGTLKMLGPVVQDPKTENNNSLVLRAESPDGSILLCGDMQFEEEYTLMSRGLLTEATVLKVPDHAEEHAVSEGLIRTVRPQVAVISTDSGEEPDTPSVRVMRLLKEQGAEVAVTQYASDGVLVTLHQGEARCEMISRELPAETDDIVISDLSAAQDVICIRNNGDQPAELGGWFIYSDQGKEIFVFPEGTILPGGASFSISALDSEDAGDFIWQENKVWHPTKEDSAYLYNEFGQLIDQW